MNFKIFIILFFLISCMATVSNAATITVDDDAGRDYTSIQVAINAATAGDTIIVEPGTYNENVLVNKSLSIKGNTTNPFDVVINPTVSTTPAVKITASNSKVSYISGSGVSVFKVGIFDMRSASNVSFDSCIAHGGDFGFSAVSCTGGSSIKNCVAFDMGHSGMFVQSSATNITGCTAFDIFYNGLWLDGDDDSYIENNSFYKASTGIKGQYVDRATVRNNLITRTATGFTSASGSAWSIYQNYFDSTTNISITDTATLNSSVYGNYWGKYNGDGFSDTATDANGDGISDSAFTQGTYTDNFPLVNLPTVGAVTLENAGNDYIAISWTRTSTDFQSYTVYRTMTPLVGFTFGSPIYTTTTSGTTTYNDTSLSPWRGYSYYVKTTFTNNSYIYTPANTFYTHPNRENIILLEGDSISSDPYYSSPEIGYAAQLMTLASGSSWADVTVGVSGQTTYDAIADWKYNIEENPADICTIMLGTNDFKLDGNTSDDFIHNIWYEAGEAKKRGMHTYVCMVIPCTGVLDADIIEHNYNLLKQCPDDVTIINMYDPIDSIPNNGEFDTLNASNYVADRIHPNTQGAGLMANWAFRQFVYDGLVNNDTIIPHGESATIPTILTSSPGTNSRHTAYQNITFSGTTSLSDCYWTVDRCIMKTQSGTEAPTFTIGLAEKDRWDVRLNTYNPENYSSTTSKRWNVYVGAVTDQAYRSRIAEFFNSIYNIFFR